MTALPALLGLGLLLGILVPPRLARAPWTEREPVLALWAWQCLVLAVILCCLLALVLTGSAAWPEVRALLFSGAPVGVAAAYDFPLSRSWAMAAAFLFAIGGLRTLMALAIEVWTARTLRRRRADELAARAPDLHPELVPAGGGGSRSRLVVIESHEPQAWSLPRPDSRLVVSTGALQRLSDRELDALLAHERGHQRARHHWLLQTAEALSAGFPSARVFALFRDQVGRLVELAADDSAARRHGRLATAIALVELNPDERVLGPHAEIPARVDRLLAGRPRLPLARRLAVGAAALALCAAPVLLALAPGLTALG
ncbi:M56 family metallopeptidase [Streptacidiphilus monticola]|uniref:M56 family metallopeptidase n=1 Tax=Streptacidiphilus monticola TaxID=2161674 RepID=A0ABW1GA32_9ACTN